MPEYAKDSFSKDNIEFKIGDAMDVKYPKNSFDVVV